MTYPDLSVATILNEYFIPVQVNVAEAEKLVEEFDAIWTPNLNILDGQKRVIYHTEGWLPPSEYAAMLITGLGHYALRKKRYQEAVSFYQEVHTKFPTSGFAPAALYYLGVGKYLESHNVEDLKESWIKLQRFYPQSSWAIRSDL